MTANPVASRIARSGSDPAVVFVFPSDVAAGLWLEAALGITGEPTISSKRFIAWDRFKEEAVQATVAGKSPVSSVLRKLYALSLASRNGSSPHPLLSSLIPPEHAESGSLFAGWIARILPQLGLWERKREKSRAESDAESADLAFLKADYARFLEENRLFEPSWQRPPLKDTGNRYVIFFPEAIEDYTEYASLLGQAPFIETVPAHIALANAAFERSSSVPEEDRATPTLRVFENTRAELTHLALEIERLLREGVASDTIAVSVPDLDTVAPYLLRELSLRGIPAEFRAGAPLGSLPAGRLFSLIATCASSSFSFASVKALLLNRLVPWRHRELAEGLIRFGIRNHCVASWKEDGREVDVWEAAFKTPTIGDTGDWRLADWYRSLARDVSAMAKARSFTEIRDRYFAFRGRFLDMDALAPADDAVLARCVAELNALSALETRYRDYIPHDPFAFFVSYLDEKKYVPQRERGGVSVFPYRVAAGTPFPYHFVIDASQDQATVLYSQLSFLRQDRRQALNLLDTDASDAFFSLYALSGARFSFADRSFSGYRTPHGFFVAQAKGEEGLDDPLAAEKAFLAGANDASPRDAALSPGSEAPSPFPDRLYPAQRDGFSAWKDSSVERGFSYLETPYGERLPILAARVAKKQTRDGDVRVSQSDLKDFETCNARWFLSRILGLKAESADAELMNERNLGLLYHDVLKRLYEAIRERDGSFNAARLDEYRAWARELAGSAAAEHAEFRGPIAEPLIGALVRRIADGVGSLLERDAGLLNGFIPEFLEDDISFSREGIRYYGKIDRISRRAADNLAVLIDYKSGKVPSPAVYKAGESARITDYQIPMYLFLAEESPESPYRGSKLEFAWFADIQAGDFRPIVNDSLEIDHGRKKGMVSREEFEPALEGFKDAAAHFASSVRELDFTRPARLSYGECLACDFRKICRATYAVRP